VRRLWVHGLTAFAVFAFTLVLPVPLRVCLTVTEDHEETAADETEKELPEDGFTVPSDITG